MTAALVEALQTIGIGERSLCTIVEVQASDNDDDTLWVRIESDQHDDCATTRELADTLAIYDEAGAPYRVTVLIPREQDPSDEPEGWQSPTVEERNALALR